MKKMWNDAKLEEINLAETKGWLTNMLDRNHNGKIDLNDIPILGDLFTSPTFPSSPSGNGFGNTSGNILDKIS